MLRCCRNNLVTLLLSVKASVSFAVPDKPESQFRDALPARVWRALLAVIATATGCVRFGYELVDSASQSTSSTTSTSTFATSLGGVRGTSGGGARSSIGGTTLLDTASSGAPSGGITGSFVQFTTAQGGTSLESTTSVISGGATTSDATGGMGGAITSLGITGGTAPVTSSGSPDFGGSSSISTENGGTDPITNSGSGGTTSDPSSVVSIGGTTPITSFVSGGTSGTTALTTNGGTSPSSGGADGGAALNTPPVPAILVNPGIGWFDSATPTVFEASATGTYDREDPATSLSYSWDWQNDGVIDAIGPSASFSFPAPGTYTIVLSVEDTGALTASATFQVLVYANADVFTVTTEVDESDVGATPNTPGGQGFSLREALAYTDAIPAKQGILVPPGMRIALNDTIEATDTAGVDVVGDGATLDGSGIKGSRVCLSISTANTRYYGLEIVGCPSRPILWTGNNDQLSRTYIHDVNGFVEIRGTGNTFGPDNVMATGSTPAINLTGANNTIAFNRIHGFVSAVAIWGTSHTLVIGNTIYACTAGIQITNGSTDNAIVQNTIVDNSGSGVEMFSSSGQVLVNNIFANNARWGISGNEAWFTRHDYNDFFANASGSCSGCVDSLHDQASDPHFIDVARGDYRLLPMSQLIDRGTDSGYDINGPQPGNGLFNGSAPDIGASETP
jgi:hypothetical protein